MGGDVSQSASRWIRFRRLIARLAESPAHRRARHVAEEKADEKREFEELKAGLQQPMPGVEVAFELMRDQQALQLAQVDGLDTKAGFIFASASLLTGVLVAWRQPPPHTWGIIAYLPMIAIAVYGGVVGFSGSAYRVGEWDEPPGPRMLRDDIVARTPDEARYITLRVIAWRYERNARKINKKARLILCAFWAMILEVLLVAIILYVEVRL